MASQEKLLLLGCGDIAQRLASRLGEKYTITGVRRQPRPVPGLELLQADCRALDDMRRVLQQPQDVIVMTMTPSDSSDLGYQQAYVDTMKTLLQALSEQAYQPRLILLVSSTSVYGQQQGEWVDEQSPTEPSHYSGKRLLEAERLLRVSPYRHCIVRFSGIYGPGRRRLIDQVIAGHGTAKTPLLYSNRIYIDDCVGVLAHLIEKQKTRTIDPLYLASDSAPVALYEVKQWLAEQLGYGPEYLQPKSLESLGRNLRSSKRCSNQRLLESGYLFECPTFREGYRRVLTALSP